MKHIIVIKNCLVYSILSYDTTDYKTERGQMMQDEEIKKDFIASINDNYKDEQFTEEELNEYYLDGEFSKTSVNGIGMTEELTIQIITSSFNTITFP